MFAAFLAQLISVFSKLH